MPLPQTSEPVCSLSAYRIPPFLDATYTIPFATAGEEKMTLPVLNDHFCWPLYSSIAYTLVSHEATKTSPSETAGDE
ncbi:MAG TPA: hypothetical protein VJL56_00815 [Candidatus Bathyarchaeia archaeon]|nr:hypothetical protein [Candidatus Bathyarchaeia archaeon]